MVYTVFHRDRQERQIMNARKCFRGIISITLIIAVLFSFTGCRILEDRNSERYGAKNLAKKEAEEIFKMLQEEDIEGLSARFSKDSRKYHNIEMEWESFFKHIDGKLVSYSGISFPGEGMGVDKEGVIYDSHLSVNFKNVKTDKGTVYKEFGYYQTRIDTRNPELVGINVFTMKDPESGTFINVGGFSSEDGR